jgi:hypothetical protein
VIAGSFEQTSKVLSDFKGQLPVDASMKQISIKLGEGKDHRQHLYPLLCKKIERLNTFHQKIYKHTFCRPTFFFPDLLEPWDVRELYIWKTVDLLLQLCVDTFPRFVAIDSGMCMLDNLVIN